MQKLSNSSFIALLSTILILLAIAKVTSLVIWWFLPSDGVELEVKQSYRPAYQRVDFQVMLGKSSLKSTKNQTHKKANTPSVSITNMILKGLYGMDFKGMAIVALKSSAKKTSVVAVGEVFSGYTLKKILKDGVIFTKNSKDYTLNMGKIKALPKSTISSVPIVQSRKNIQRKDINDYISNRKNIWNDIAIDPIKDGNSLKGFLVKRVNKNSALGVLGLEKNDVIIAANNVELKSLKDVLNIYTKIKTLKTIQIVVLRDGQEQELVYEID